MVCATIDATSRSTNSIKAYPRELPVRLERESFKLDMEPNCDRNWRSCVSSNAGGMCPMYITREEGSFGSVFLGRMDLVVSLLVVSLLVNVLVFVVVVAAGISSSSSLLSHSGSVFQKRDGYHCMSLHGEGTKYIVRME